LLLPTSLLTTETRNKLLGTFKLGLTISDIIFKFSLVVTSCLKISNQTVDLILDDLELCLLNLKFSINLCILGISFSECSLFGLNN